MHWGCNVKTLISEGLLRKLPTANSDVYDTRTRGLVLRCRASGRHTYRLQVRRGRWLTIGAVDDFSPKQARVEAERLRGDLARGKDPEAERRLARAATFRQYLANEYGPWVIANRRTGSETLRRSAQADVISRPQQLPRPSRQETACDARKWYSFYTRCGSSSTPRNRLRTG